MDLIDEITEREGAATNDPDDSGGRTQFGICERVHPEAWANGDVSRDEARAIYQHTYITQPGFDKIEFAPLRTQLIDFGVNAGPKTATRLLQRLLRVHADGVVGPQTLAALTQRNPVEVNNLLVAARESFYYEVVRANPKNKKFLKGWLKRAHLFFIQR